MKNRNKINKKVLKKKEEKQRSRKLKNKQEHQKSNKSDSSITPKPVDQVSAYKCFLKHVDIGELDDRIDLFRGLDFKNMSYEEVQSAIGDVILFDTPTGKSSMMMKDAICYPVGTRFYRVRTLSENDTVLPLDGMSKVSDCWEPPKDIVKAGRLNKDGEPLLYTSPDDPNVAVQEMGIEDNQLFSLIVYESTENIKATIIGSTANTDKLNKEESIKSKMLDRFFKHEFSRDVGAGAEYLYRISESITKTYFNLPIQVQDAWQYPSIKNNGSHNVCFRKEGSSKLKLIGTQIASIVRDNEGVTYKILKIATAIANETHLTYHEMGSETQKSIFPEIKYA